jgi:hypothetical protein
LDKGAGNPLKVPVVLGTVGVKNGTLLGIVWSPGLLGTPLGVPWSPGLTGTPPGGLWIPGLKTPGLAVPEPAPPRLGTSPPPRLWANASGQASHPAPQTIAPHINLHDIGFIEASLSCAPQGG